MAATQCRKVGKSQCLAVRSDIFDERSRIASQVVGTRDAIGGRTGTSGSDAASLRGVEQSSRIVAIQKLLEVDKEIGEEVQLPEEAA
jgi:hypothetical protein